MTENYYTSPLGRLAKIDNSEIYVWWTLILHIAKFHLASFPNNHRYAILQPGHSLPFPSFLHSDITSKSLSKALIS
jgi:hypothetical protein